MPLRKAVPFALFLLVSALVLHPPAMAEADRPRETALLTTTGCGETCSDSVHAFRWISAASAPGLSSAEELCDAIPNAAIVRQRFPESTGTHTYDCASQTCSGAAESPNPCASSCFCVDEGEGFDVTTVGPSRFHIPWPHDSITYSLTASERYLISIPAHGTLTAASDLAAAVVASIPGAGVEVARLNCATRSLEVYRDFSGPPHGVDFTLEPGEAVRILSTVSGSFTLLPGTGDDPACPCTDGDDDGYGLPAHFDCVAGGVADCAPGDDRLWSKPGVVDLIAADRHPSDDIVLSWSSPPDAGGDPALLRYDTLRAALPGNFTAVTPPNLCVPPSDNAMQGSADPPDPDLGAIWYYLVRAQNDCGEGSVGLDRFGLPRPARACPCPTSPCTPFVWTAESDSPSAAFGYVVATAGDVNGDGYDDVIVGAPEHIGEGPGLGLAAVYHGSASGLAATPAWLVKGVGRFGWSVASAGDVNADGYDDVIVGAHNAENPSNNEGKAFLYLGSATGLATIEAWSAEGNSTDAHFGFSVAAAGDVNDDGYDDVIVGAPLLSNGNADEGKAYLFLGGTGGLSAAPDWTYEGEMTGARLGESVAAAGDVNGDGFDDVIVGAHEYTNGQLREGTALIFLGTGTGLAATPAWQVESDQAIALLGRWVSSAGDVNADGYDDVIVDAFDYDHGGLNTGRAFVYLGSATGPATTAAWTFAGGQSNARLFPVAAARDVNGDGYDDVIVGVFSFDNGEVDEGVVHVFMGSASGLSATPALSFESDQANAEFGITVAPAGDVNGDGFDDMIVGAHHFDNGETDEGRAFVIHGAP